MVSSESNYNPQNPPADDAAQNFGQAALYWYNFGLSVIPLLPGKKVPAVKWDPWRTELSHHSIRAYWAAHPDHEVGFIVDDGLIVFDADTPKAVAALAQLEEAFDVRTALVVKTTKGEHHYYRRGPGTFAKSDSHSTQEHPERIDVKTGRAMVVLPPSTGKEIEYMEVEHADELPEVGQEFIDAVFHHNGREAPRRPAPRPEVIALPGGDSGKLQQLEALLNPLDPDKGYEDWLHVGMACPP